MDRIGPGTLLAGRYRLAERVRDDGTGSSWRAEDLTLERPVAVTVLAADHARVQSTLDAARRAALVDDPRLQRVLGVGLEGSSGYVVMEWVTGQDANALAGKVSEQEAVRVVTEAAEALRTAATRSLHHGRLSPRHVVRASDGSVRVLGTAIDVAATGQPTPAAAARPEARDVRDLGAVLYALLSGHWPFGGLEGLEAAPTEKGRPVPVVQLRPDVSAPLVRLLEDTLAGSGADTLGALVGQLHDTRAALQTPAPTAPTAPTAMAPAGPTGAGAGAAAAGDDTEVLTPVPADAGRPGAAGPAATPPPAPATPAPGTPTPATPAAASGPAAGAGAGAGPVGATPAARPPSGTAGTTAAGTGAAVGGVAAAGAAAAGVAAAGAAAAGAAGAVGATGASGAGSSAAGSSAAGSAAVGAAAAGSSAPAAVAGVGGAAPSRAAARASARAASAPQAPAPGAPVGEVRPPGYPTSARPGPVAPAVQDDDGWDLLPVADEWDEQWDPQYDEGYADAGAGWQEPQPWDSEPYDPDAGWPGPATARESTVPVVPAGRGAGRRPAGAGTGVVVVLLMGAFVVGGLVFALERFRNADDVAAPVPVVTETVAPSVEPSPAPEPSVEPEPTAGVVEVLSPAGVQALDPQGDGEENDQDAPRAIDGDPESGWTTQRYNSQDFGGLKDGLGLVFDLGEPRVVTQVLLDAPGDDGVFEIRTANGPGFDGSTVVATGETGDGTAEIVPEAPVTTQFVLVWFTSLPEVDGDWRGVVNELQVEVQ